MYHDSIRILSKKNQNLYLKKHPDNLAFEKQELQLPRRLSAFKTFSRTRTRLKSRIKNDQHHFFDALLLDIIAKENVLLSSLWSTSLQDGSNSEDGNNLEAHMAKVRLDATQKVWQCFKFTIFQLNLDEEELIVMESCHSYIHDMLRSLTSPNQTVILRPWK